MNPLILVTGATGYIGRRLVRRLEAEGHRLRCLVRDRRKLEGRAGASTDIVEGDCLNETDLDRALSGVDTAYYLVHSMASGSDFAAVDRRAADIFGRAAARAGLRRIVYLGGLADATGPLSTHLRSRAETGEVLRASAVPVVEFRASIVIGVGSLSFEMVSALVERLPIMICPRWVDTLTQPIAVDDLLAYLVAALALGDEGNRIFEIGGSDVVSYGEIMREYARQRGLRRRLLPVPLLTPRLSGLWLALVTPAQARVGRALVEGLRNPTVVRSRTARETFSIVPQPLAAALRQAIDDGATARHRIDMRRMAVEAPPPQAFAPVRRIGGATGWYFGDVLWRMRGAVDHWLGGVGMTRGRRDPEWCVAGDAIDGRSLRPGHATAAFCRHEDAGKRVAGIRDHSARQRAAIDDSPDRHVRPTGAARPDLLVHPAPGASPDVPAHAGPHRAARPAIAFRSTRPARRGAAPGRSA